MMGRERVGKGELLRVAGVKDVRGFTLIELMIVVAVVAILASIALPAYDDSVRKSRRGQAKADMVELAQRAERWHSTNNTYAGFWASVPVKVSPGTGGTVAYNFTQVEAPNTFTITATPTGGQVKDTRCGTLTINQAGTKTKTGTGQLSDCW